MHHYVKEPFTVIARGVEPAVISPRKARRDAYCVCKITVLTALNLWSYGDSNPGPPACKAGALAN